MKIGILGGTFDPPHIGHLILAGEAQAQLQLELVLFVLTRNPPHKPRQYMTSVDTRLKLLEAAMGDNPAFRISRVDIDRPAPYYAVDTVRILSNAYPQAQLVYLMGGDSLRDLPAWHTPQDFVAACDAIGVMRRPGEQLDWGELDQVLPELKNKVDWIDAPLIEIASSMIRQRIAQDQPFRYFVPPSVYDLIQQHGLYRPD